MGNDHDRALRFEQVNKLLWSADENNGLPESERIRAANTLLDLLRTQVSELKRGERTNIDPPLITAINCIGMRVLTDEDPIDALARLLGRKNKPGKRAKNTDRDFEIAIDVASKMYDGMSLDDACVAIAEPRKLSPERVENIYKADRKAARTAEALRRLQDPASQGPSTQPPGDTKIGP
jgi:hypothetical protein